MKNGKAAVAAGPAPAAGAAAGLARNSAPAARSRE
jgi:hypothetical protein